MITYFIVWIFLMLFCIFYLWDKFSIAHSVIQVNFRVVDILWHILTILLSLDTKCRCSSFVPFASKCVLCVYLLLFLNFFYFFFESHWLQGHPNQIWGSECVGPNVSQECFYGTQSQVRSTFNHLDILQVLLQSINFIKFKHI